jgi:hypothetical protein
MEVKEGEEGKEVKEVKEVKEETQGTWRLKEQWKRYARMQFIAFLL